MNPARVCSRFCGALYLRIAKGKEGKKRNKSASSVLCAGDRFSGRFVHKMYAVGWNCGILRNSYIRRYILSLCEWNKQAQWMERGEKEEDTATRNKGHIIPYSYPWNRSQRRRRRDQFHFIPFLWSLCLCVRVHFGHPIECRMFFVYEIVFRLNTYIIVMILWPNAFRGWPRAEGGDSNRLPFPKGHIRKLRRT